MANFPIQWSKNESVHPLRAMTRMQRQIDRLFDDFMIGNWAAELPNLSESVFQPPCDVQETDSHYLLSFDLPGMSKNDVKIEFQDHSLKIYGERNEQRQQGHGAKMRTERLHGSFARVVALPPNTQGDAIEAQFENGVLHVVVPKAEVVQPKQIQIGEGKPGLASKLLGKKEGNAA